MPARTFADFGVFAAWSRGTMDMISKLHDDLVDSAGTLDDPQALRVRMAQDGYLFIRGLLDKGEVARVRADILDVCRRHDWLQPGAAGDAAQVNAAASCAPAEPAYDVVYGEVISVQSYNELAHAEPILLLMETLFEASDVIPRPARRSHLIFPQGDVGATPPHQDFPHEQGAVHSYTAWIPLGDCPRELGGLAVWPGSLHRHVIEHGFVPGVGGLGIHPDCMPDVEWYSIDYQIGDVLVFHSLTVHGALPNRTGDRLRISADFRYQRIRDPFSDHMLRPTGGRLTWAQVYAGWDSTQFQYYWKDFALVSEPYDHQYYDKRDQEVFALAREGDPPAVEFLSIISTRNPDPAIRQAARDLMDELAARSGSAS
jgi:ectoine hydroxylase-related dioxygenase (phytanoyl-CoA dioxygenase family)